MPVLVVAEAPAMGAEQDKAMMEALNLESDPPVGVKVRIAGPTENGWRFLGYGLHGNDPQDSSAPALIDPPIYTNTGDSEGGAAVDFGPIPLTAGDAYVITEMATPATPADNSLCLRGTE